MFVIEIRTPDPTPDSPGTNQSPRPRISEALSLSSLRKKSWSGNGCMQADFSFSKPFLGGCERGVMSVHLSGMIPLMIPLALAGRPDSCVSAQV